MTGRLGAVIFLIWGFLGIARLHAAEDAARWETQKREAMRAAGADEKLKGDIEKLFAAPSRENFYTAFRRVEKRKEFAGNDEAAINELAELGEKSIAPDAVRLLRDEDKDVRWMAVDALGKLGERNVIPQIAKLLRDEQSWVMESAAAAMAEILKEKWMPILVRHVPGGRNTNRIPSSL